MTRDEKHIWIAMILCLTILLSGIGACTYQEQVVTPRVMADKGYCWVTTLNPVPNARNQYYSGYAPCSQAASEQK
jgi:hypothetical protein